MSTNYLQHLPESLTGLNDLIELATNEFPNRRRSVPRDSSKLFSDFCWYGFIDALVPDSYVEYVAHILLANGALQIGTTSSTLRWEASARRILSRESGTAQGRKSHALTHFLEPTRLQRLADSFYAASHFFQSEHVDGEWLKRRTDSIDQVNNLVTELGYSEKESHIPNYGPTKLVLWLHQYNIGLHLAPPAKPIKRFIHELTSVEPPYAEQDEIDLTMADFFTYYVPPIRNLAAEETLVLNKEVTARQIQAAVWPLYASRSLIKNKKISRKLTPVAFIDYLRINNINLDNSIETISDIDELDTYASEILDYVSSLE